MKVSKKRVLGAVYLVPCRELGNMFTRPLSEQLNDEHGDVRTYAVFSTLASDQN